VEEKDRKTIAEQVALFRYGVIADLVRLPPGTKGIYRKIEEKAAAEYTIPGSTRTQVAAETIRDWIKNYRKGGFDALLPRVRRDAGAARRLPAEVSDALVQVAEDRPELGVKQVIAVARQKKIVSADLVLPYSTVHRLLAIRGLTGARKGNGNGKDHRRFSFQKAGDLWMSDVMHGPSVFTGGGRKRKTYLIAFLDDATRVVPFACFALSENTAAFLPVLKQALMRRGIPKRLFVDNGANYRSHQLALVCAKLGITLIHARAYHPEAKGKQERWFRTVRMQLLPMLRPDDLASLEALNRRLWAYVEGEYHRNPHRGLDGETPLDRWGKVGDEVKYPDPRLDLDDLFLFEAKRQVQKDRTVSLHGVVYEVDAVLVGETVTLRFDPSRPGKPIQVWDKGRRVQDARVVDTFANCFVKRDRPAKTTKEKAPPEGGTEPVTTVSPPPDSGIRYAEPAVPNLAEGDERHDDGGDGGEEGR
jgi:putative transposase